MKIRGVFVEIFAHLVYAAGITAGLYLSWVETNRTENYRTFMLFLGFSVFLYILRIIFLWHNITAYKIQNNLQLDTEGESPLIVCINLLVIPIITLLAISLSGFMLDGIVYSFVLAVAFFVVLANQIHFEYALQSSIFSFFREHTLFDVEKIFSLFLFGVIFYSSVTTTSGLLFFAMVFVAVVFILTLFVQLKQHTLTKKMSVINVVTSFAVATFFLALGLFKPDRPVASSVLLAGFFVLTLTGTYLFGKNSLTSKNTTEIALAVSLLVIFGILL